MVLNSYISISALACYITLIVLVLKKGYRETLYQTMALYLVAMAYWQLTTFMVSLSREPELALFWYRMMTIGPGIVFILFFCFVTVFRNDPAREKMREIGYFLSLGLALTALLGGRYLVPAVEKHPVTGLFIPELGLLIPLFFIVSLFFTGLAIHDLVKDYRGSKDEEHRNRIRYLLIAITLVFGGSLVNFSIDLRGYPIDVFANLSHALLLTYTIFRHRLLNIRLVLKAGLLYSTLTIIITALYLLLMFALNSAFNNLAGYTTITAAVIMAFLIAFFFNSIRERFQQSIERLFWGKRYEYYRMMRDFATASVTLISLEQLAQKITAMIKDTLQVEVVGLYLRNTDQKDYRLWDCRGPAFDCRRVITFREDSPLVRWLALHQQPLHLRELDLYPQLRGLWKSEINNLENLQTEVLFPLFSKDTLIGFLSVSKHNSGRPLNEHERELMKFFANQIAVAVNNALNFERVRILSITDPLTGVYNRHHFNAVLTSEKEKIKKGGSLGLIMLDVYNFKSYNDRYGHPAGDLLLKELAGLLQSSIRAGDTVVRYGGDEFAIILPHATRKTGLQIKKRISQKITQWNQMQGLKLFGEKLGVSMGVYAVEYNEIDNLVKMADKDLYLSRENEERRNLLQSLERIGRDRQQLSLEMILGLARAVEFRDPYTRGHSERVSDYAVALAREMRLQGPETEKLGYAALLHDLGKIAVPKAILQKEGKLSEEEFRLIREHPVIGGEIVQEINLLQDMAPLIRHHHERMDGRGYPDGLAGKEIPLGARILAVADSYDAMFTDRPYRKGLTEAEAEAELKRHAGTQFDPEIVYAFINMQSRSKAMPESL